MKKILLVTGSVRPGNAGENVTRAVLHELSQYNGVEATAVNFIDLVLPFFNSPHSPNDPQFVPEDPNVKRWTEMVENSDAVILVTPEYNASTSAVLKNAIDWIGAQWNNKPVAIIGYGWSAAKSSRSHLTDILNRLKAHVIEPQAGLHFEKDITLTGEVKDPSNLQALITPVLDATTTIPVAG